MQENRFHFTQAAIGALPLPEKGKRGVYYDDVSRGLCVMITDTGKRSFYVLRKFRGRTERVLLGRYPDTSVSFARQRAGETNAKFDAGQNVNEMKRHERKEMTLGELFQLYFKRHSKPRNRRPEKQQYHFAKYLGHWERRRISEITKLDVQTWHARLGDERGTRTANIALALLRAMYNRAIAWDLFDGQNPTRGTQKFKEISRDRFLQPEELRRFLENLKAEPETTRDFVLILLLTGVRKSNALAMRWSELDLDDGVWRIPDTKIGEPLVLPLSTQARALLVDRKERLSQDAAGSDAEAHSRRLPAVPQSPRNTADGTAIDSPTGGNLPAVPQSTALRLQNAPAPGLSETALGGADVREPACDFVFPGDGASGHLKDPKKAWAALLKRAKIRDFRMHDLRRTHGSYMAATGANQFVISRALGHKNLSTTAIYARLNLDPIRTAAEHATAVMFSGVEGILPNKETSTVAA